MDVKCPGEQPDQSPTDCHRTSLKLHPTLSKLCLPALLRTTKQLVVINLDIVFFKISIENMFFEVKKINKSLVRHLQLLATCKMCFNKDLAHSKYNYKVYRFVFFFYFFFLGPTLDAVSIL